MHPTTSSGEASAQPRRVDPALAKRIPIARGTRLNPDDSVLVAKLQRCNPDQPGGVAADLASARQKQDQTLVEMVVEIIREHSPTGTESEDGVPLRLC